jgi:UTP--glucose-1-phosphate uridylyltransferase
MPSGKIAYVRQNKPLGLGHAVACASHLIGDEPFAVVLPDDVIRGEVGGLAQLVEAHAEVGGCVVAATRVPKSDISRYGVIAPDEFAPEGAPSDLAVVGRYILTPSVMRRLETARPGLGGEIQLTDAIAAEIEQGGTVHGLCLEGERFDCGSKRGYLEATVALALERADVGGDLRKFILARGEKTSQSWRRSPPRRRAWRARASWRPSPSVKLPRRPPYWDRKRLSGKCSV